MGDRGEGLESSRQVDPENKVIRENQRGFFKKAKGKAAELRVEKQTFGWRAAEEMGTGGGRGKGHRNVAKIPLMPFGREWSYFVITSRY